MKRDIVYSLLLHLMLFLLAVIIMRANKEAKRPAPFVATIITPEEMREKAPSAKSLSRQEKKLSRMPRLPSNLPPPKEFSAVPSSPSAARKARAAAPSEKAATTDASRSQARGSSEPERKPDQNGLAPEQLPMKGNGGRDSSQTGRQFPSARTIREKLFDSEVILGSTKGEKSKNDNAITFDTKEYKYYGYMQRLKEKIQGVWKYPAEAEQKRINGELYIKFTIKKDGRLAAVELVHTSGYTFLDDAAIRALREADPYWPLPDAWNEKELTITGRFIYYFQGTYIR